jgi:hypothetical protein
VIGVLFEETIETELLAGRMACHCGGQLRPWSYARTRLIRHHDGKHHPLRPRRGRCVACLSTHVLLPAASLPRRRDATEIVGQALVQAALGHGHRSIAEELGLPPSTVPNWLRRARSQADRLYRAGTEWTFQVDGHLPATKPQATALGDAIESLGQAAAALIGRVLDIGTSPWRVIAIITGGLLVPGGPDG